jgi:hypothetical protein
MVRASIVRPIAAPQFFKALSTANRPGIRLPRP